MNIQYTDSSLTLLQELIVLKVRQLDDQQNLLSALAGMWFSPRYTQKIVQNNIDGITAEIELLRRITAIRIYESRQAKEA